MRCKSWRPTDKALTSNQVGPPGKNRQYWTTCRNQTKPGEIRCPDCANRLAAHPDVTIRRHLAAETNLPTPLLHHLTTDGDTTVQTLAETALKQKQP